MTESVKVVRPEDSRDHALSILLFLVELVGLLCAFGCSQRAQKFLRMPEGHIACLTYSIYALAIFSLGVWWFHRTLGWNLFKQKMRWGPASRMFRMLGLRGATTTLALANLIVAIGCIYVTGGALISPYTPFLLVVVPTTIVLGEHRLLVWLYFVASSVAFWLLAIREQPLDILRPREYKTCLTIITAVCAVFPVVIYSFESKMSKDQAT